MVQQQKRLDCNLGAHMGHTVQASLPNGRPRRVEPMIEPFVRRLDRPRLA
jgi:hypothetical protein